MCEVGLFVRWSCVNVCKDWNFKFMFCYFNVLIIGFGILVVVFYFFEVGKWFGGNICVIFVECVSFGDLMFELIFENWR